MTNAEVAVEGIPYMAGSYKICEESDQLIWFSPSEYCAGNDIANDLGVFNKISGDIRYHVGDALFILSCKKTDKLIK